MNTQAWLVTLAAWSILGIGVCDGAEPRVEDQRFDPAALRELPDNTWLDLQLTWRGGNEIPAVFDAANQVFFKYGGCGDQTSRINIEGSSRPNETYGNSCWVVNMARGQWELRRPRDVSFPKNRPANGCSRCFAYDSHRRVIWMYGGISNGGGGGDQWDLWTYDAQADTFKQWHTKNRPPEGDGANTWMRGGDVFVYDSHADLLIMPRGEVTWVFDPKTGNWQARNTPAGPVGPGHYASMVYDAAARRLVYPTMEPTGKTVPKLQGAPPATENTFWRSKGDLWHECRFTTWTYDSQTNHWARLDLPDDAPRPSSRWRFGLAYDSNHQAVILIGGSTDTWERDEKYFHDVWVLDNGAGRWQEMQPHGAPPDVRHRECRHCAYAPEQNVVLFLNHAGSLAAYRYKK